MDSSATDEDLAVRAAAGDQGAFTALMLRHVDSLHRFAFRYLGSADEASEAVQQSFVATWLALGRYDPHRPFAIWIRYIALNKCRDLARRRKVRRLLFGRTLDEEPVGAIADNDSSAEEHAIAADRRRRVTAAVAALPTHLKEPLVLTFFGGLTQKEAASVLKLTPKAVELRIARAKQKLSKVLLDLKMSGDNLS